MYSFKYLTHLESLDVNVEKNTIQKVTNHWNFLLFCLDFLSFCMELCVCVNAIWNGKQKIKFSEYENWKKKLVQDVNMCKWMLIDRNYSKKKQVYLTEFTHLVTAWTDLKKMSWKFEIFWNAEIQKVTFYQFLLKYFFLQKNQKMLKNSKHFSKALHFLVDKCWIIISNFFNRSSLCSI